jgi:dTMP kinase
MPSMFVTFEGIDGSGKSTQAELLTARLESDGRDVLGTREPGGTELGERIRELLLHGGHVAPWAEALLYAASRAQHVEEVIRPALARGAWVVCDRYVDSSVAYQGVGRGLGLERVLDLNLTAVGGLMPDRTFLLELDVAALPGRLGGEHDRLERESDEFHARVAGGYRELAARFPERIVALDARLPAETLAEEVYGALRVSA